MHEIVSGQDYSKISNTYISSPNIVPATLDDVEYIVSESLKNRDAVQFIPKIRYEEIIEKNKYSESLLMCFVNNKPIGFCYAGHNRSGTMKIYQIYIQPDARRNGYATILITKSVSYTHLTLPTTPYV